MKMGELLPLIVHPFILICMVKSPRFCHNINEGNTLSIMILAFLVDGIPPLSGATQKGTKTIFSV